MHRARFFTAALTALAVLCFYGSSASAQDAAPAMPEMAAPIDIMPLPSYMPVDEPMPEAEAMPVAPVEAVPPAPKVAAPAPALEDPIKACRDANVDEGYVRLCLARKHEAAFAELKKTEDAALQAARAGGKDWHAESKKAQGIANSAMAFETFLVSECQQHAGDNEDAANAVTGCEIQVAQMRIAMLKQP